MTFRRLTFGLLSLVCFVSPTPVGADLSNSLRTIDRSPRLLEAVTVRSIPDLSLPSLFPETGHYNRLLAPRPCVSRNEPNGGLQVQNPEQSDSVNETISRGEPRNTGRRHQRGGVKRELHPGHGARDRPHHRGEQGDPRRAETARRPVAGWIEKRSRGGVRGPRGQGWGMSPTAGPGRSTSGRVLGGVNRHDPSYGAGT